MDTTTISDKELDQLENLLASDIFKEEAMTLDYLQGFLCAIVSGPEVISPGVWMPAVLGEAPQYESKAQVQEVMDLLMKFYNSIATALFNDDDFDLILYGLEEDPD